MQDQWSYPGRELESMAFAMNYHRWILEIFRPYLGKRIVEVGAGAGSFSKLILETSPEKLDAIEPCSNMYPRLAAQLQNADGCNVGRAHHGTLMGNIEMIRKAGAPDSVIYVNVLEHVEHDVEELAAIHSLLRPQGHALIFVPANPWLMGSMDHELGHFRRYTMKDLRGKCEAVGLTIRVASHFDFLGIAPWWLKYCFFKSRTMEPAALRFYDRCVVPASRFLESVIPPPIGKNIVLVAGKPG
jgi:SAM-dependent methyltransferase